MSVQISCTICGASSPRAIDPVPAAEWSRSHRCSTQRLIELAAERQTISRLGKLTARDTDRDLVIMGEMAKRLAECAEPQGEPSVAQVEAAATRLWQIDWGYLDSWAAAPEKRKDHYRSTARVALRAAGGVR